MRRLRSPTSPAASRVRRAELHPFLELPLGAHVRRRRRGASHASRDRASPSAGVRRRHELLGLGRGRRGRVRRPDRSPRSAMLPPMRNARPPNIFFSVTPASLADQLADPVGQLLVVRHLSILDRAREGRASQPAFDTFRATAENRPAHPRKGRSLCPGVSRAATSRPARASSCARATCRSTTARRTTTAASRSSSTSARARSRARTSAGSWSPRSPTRRRS